MPLHVTKLPGGGSSFRLLFGQLTAGLCTLVGRRAWLGPAFLAFRLRVPERAWQVLRCLGQTPAVQIAPSPGAHRWRPLTAAVASWKAVALSSPEGTWDGGEAPAGLPSGRLSSLWLGKHVLGKWPGGFGREGQSLPAAGPGGWACPVAVASSRPPPLSCLEISGC